MKFTLEIDLGNDAMQTLGEVENSIWKLLMSHRITKYQGSRVKKLKEDSGKLMDINGNTVGKWEVTA